jgi:hypothetical protein
LTYPGVALSRRIDNWGTFKTSWIPLDEDGDEEPAVRNEMGDAELTKMLEKRFKEAKNVKTPLLKQFKLDLDYSNPVEGQICHAPVILAMRPSD